MKSPDGETRPRLPKAGTIQVVPSILSADFARLADELATVKAAGLEVVHLDVMDGHFVPNITIGPPVIARLRACTDLVFDTHLMITSPERYIDAFVDAGADHITFHIETCLRPLELIDRLHKMGVSAGLCLNPDTPVDQIEPFAAASDMVLVMTVQPGFGGQAFMPDAARKVITVRQLVGPQVRVEVDGGIDPQTTPIVVGYGADTLVAGNAIFGQADRIAAIMAIQAAASTCGRG
ncbi:MAG: ribulose-phosphate 3-epimerase [Sedimentisphaerales bacterium]|nr:ribulose-phosphate 3-epimerase [Sedimentisphaerales bacterium]